jgi:undecaprenyl-diphosphatase
MDSFDQAVSSFINAFAHRSLRFDEFVIFLSSSHLLKGGVIVGIIWWVWFEAENTPRKREALLAATIASFPALIIARIISWSFFRARPFNEPHLLFHVPFGIQAAEWEGNSSFPSDHAVLFFALAAGIWLASRRAGWFALAYTAIVICLPRVYIGEHYSTDILAGGLLGISMAWLANCSPVRKPLTGWALRWMDSKPWQFYCLAFLTTYQIAELFSPILKILKFTASLIQGKPFD